MKMTGACIKALAAVALINAVVARAADHHWNGAGATSDNLDQPDNWWDGVPAAGDNLFFDNTTGARHAPFSNFGPGSYFGTFITYTNAGGIKFRGDKTYLLKFENFSDPVLLESEADLSNRTGPDSDLEINPVGAGGVTVSNVDLQNGMQLKVWGSRTLTVNGALTQSGAGHAALAVLGGGRVVLNGANALGGTTTISNGAIQVGNGGTAGQLGLGNVVNNGALIYNRSDAQTWTNLISGTGSLTKSGSGALTLTRANIYGGATIISNGTLGLQSAPAPDLTTISSNLAVWLDATDISGAGSANNPASGTQVSNWVNKAPAAAGVSNFAYSGGSSAPYFIATNNVLNGKPTVHFWGGMLNNSKNFGNAVTVFYVGRMSGGANYRLLSAANNWLLGFWSGNMNVMHWNNTPSVLAGTLDYGHHLFVGAANGTTAWGYNADVGEWQIGTGALGTGTGPSGLSLGGSLTYNEQSYGDISELIVYTNFLSAADRFQVEQYLRAKWFGDLPATSAVSLAVSGATLDIGAVDQTLGQLSGVAGTEVKLGGGSLTVGRGSVSNTFAGVISGTGGVIKVGSNIMTLEGPVANTYSGTTLINHGTLVAQKPAGVVAIPGPIVMVNNLSPVLNTTNDNQLGGNGVMTFVNEVNNSLGNVRFNLMGTMQSVAGLVETDAYRNAVIQNSEAAWSPANTATSTLSLTGSGTYLFNGYLRDATGKLKITKTGSGTQTLSGDRITYTGLTAVNGGTLTLANAGAFASAILSNNATVKLYADANSAGVISSILSGPGGWIVDGPGGGTIYQNRVILRGHGSDHTGAISVVNSGKLWVDQAGRNAISDSALVDVGATGQFVIYQGVAETIGGLSGSGNVYGGDAAGTSALTVGGGNGSASFGGVLQNNLSTLTVTKMGSGTQTFTGANTYTGATTVSSGVLALGGIGSISNSTPITVAAGARFDASAVGGFALGVGKTLQGSGTVTGPVVTAEGSLLLPGLAAAPGTLSFGNDLSLNAGTTNLFDLYTDNTPGGGINDLISVGGLLEPSNAVLLVNAVTPLTNGAYRLFNYTGGKATTFNTNVLGNTSRKAWTLDEATGGQVNLLVSGSYAALRWLPQADANWDLATSNWFDTVNTITDRFATLDAVLFDDEGAYSNTVTITTAVQPGSIVVNSSSNYTFTGAGKITGGVGITKLGTSTLVLANSGGNDFRGGVLVSNGMLTLGHASALPVGGTVTVKPGATFDFAGQGTTATRAYTFAIEGSGTAGQGAIDNTGLILNERASVSNLTLLADASVGAGSTNRWDIGTGATGMRLLGNGYALTKVGAGEITVRPEFVSNVTRMVINAGRLKHEAFSQTSAGTTATTNIVNSGGTLASYGTLTLNYPVEFSGGIFNNENGTATWTGPMAMVSNTAMVLANPVVLAGAVSGPGSITKSGGATLTLSNANTFAGGLIINNGGGQVSAASASGNSIPNRLTLGSGVDGGGAVLLRTFNNDQFGPGVVITNNGSWNDWTYFILLGTTQTVAGLSDETGAGVLESTEGEAGIASDSLLIFNGAGDYSCNSFTRDRSGGTGTSRLRMLKLGSGTQTLAGSNRGQTSDFAGGVIVSNGWINLKSSRAAGSGLIELAGGGLALDGIGLAEGRSLANGWNTTFANNEESVKLKAENAMNPSVNNAQGPTWCYTGYLQVTNAAPVSWTFGEQYDDYAYLSLDGEVLLNNGSWNTPTIATRTLTPGIHALEIRVCDTGGGIGPNNGWTNGVGYDVEGRNAATPGNFVPFVDPGDGSFLQTLVRVTNAIVLRADAQLKVSSAWGPTNMITSALTESGGSRGVTKVGVGALLLTAATQALTGPVTVEAGKLLVLGDITSAVAITAKTGAVIGGSPVAGSVVVENLAGVQATDPSSGANYFAAAALTLGEDASSTTRVGVVLGNQTNTVIVTGAGGLTANGKVLIDIRVQGLLYGGVFDLIRYTGAINGGLTNFEIGAFSYPMLAGPAYLQDSGSAIQLVVPAATAILWDGAPANLWDVGVSASFMGYVGGPDLLFNGGEPLLFCDLATVATVDVSAAVGPGSVRIDTTNAYVFQGLGSITGAQGLVKAGPGTLTMLNTNAFTGPLIISNGVLSVGALANAGTASPIGAQGAAAANLVLNGGTLRYTGPSSTINRMFTVGGNGGVMDISSAGQTLTINGAGWNIAGTLRKRGAGTLRFTGYKDSYDPAPTDLIIEEGQVRFDSAYWFPGAAGPYPYDATSDMKVIITNGASLYTVLGALGFQPWPGDGSLNDVTVEKGSTWYLGDANGVNALAIRGGQVLGGRIIPLYGLAINVLASDTNGYCTSEWNPYAAGNGWDVNVEDGTANPDFIQDGPINGNISTLNKNGAGRMIYRNGGFGPSTLNVNAGILQVGDAVVAGSLGGAGTVNNAATVTYGQSITVTEGKSFAGTGTLIQAGIGVTILTAANTYSGPTIISNGTLRVNGSLAAGSAVTVLPSGTLAGSGAASGTVALAGTAIPGTGVGTLTTGSETWQGGATYRFEVSDMLGTFGANPGWDRLQVEGGLTINATAASQMAIRVSSVNGSGGSAIAANLAANSSYTMAIARVTGAISGFAANAFTIDLTAFVSPYAITNVAVQQAGTDIDLVLQTGSAYGALVWDADDVQTPAQDGSGNWDLANTNWWTGASNQGWVQTSAAILGADTNSGGSYTLTVAAPTIQATSLTFPTGSTYTIAGTNTLSVLGGTVAVSNGAATISALLGGGGFTKTGPGTLTLSRAGTASTYAGALTVAEGALIAAGSVGNGTVRGDLRVNSGATFQLASPNIVVDTAHLDVAAGGLVNLAGNEEWFGNLTGGGTVTSSSQWIRFDYLQPGIDYVFWGTTVGGWGIYLENNQTRGGTQWLNGSNAIWGIQVEGPNTLRLSSNGVTALTDILSINPGGGWDDAKVVVEQGHYLKALRIELQNASGHDGQFFQNGGTVVATDANFEEGAIRVGHYPGDEMTTYWMNGGELYITNAGTYSKLALGIDGYGTFNQSGGTATVKQISLNERGGTGGGFLNFSNGLLKVGGGGITTEGSTYAVTFGGGTLEAWSNFTVSVNSSLTGASTPLRVNPAGYTINWSGTLNGIGGLLVDGTGTVVLVATNTHIGATVVSNGTLRLDGSIANSAVVGVNGTLGGTGLVGSAITSDGTVAPGTLIGTLRVGFTFSQTASAKLAIELGGNTQGTYDVLAVAGFATLDGALSVTNVAYTPVVGDSFTVLTASAISGAFLTTNLPVLAAPSFWQVTYNSDSVVLSVAQPPLTPYQQWALAITNAADRSDQSDPDNDSYVNLWEYSQGTDPTNGADGVKVLMVKTNGVFALKFNFVTSAVDIVYHVEAAYGFTNNATWDCITSNYLAQGWTGDANVTSTNTGPVVQAFAEDNDPFAARRGLRLRIERP